MDDLAAPDQPAPQPQAAARGRSPEAPQWHAGWALGVAAAGSALLAGLGALPWLTVGALALGVVPGLVGYVWSPRGEQRRGLLALWTLCAGLAVIAQGGVTGPLAAWCAAPLLAGALLGVLAEGAVAAAVCLAVVVLVELAGATPAVPDSLARLGLSAAALLTLGGAAAGAIAILARRAADREAVVELAAPQIPPSDEAEPPAEGRLRQDGETAAESQDRIVVLERRLRTAELARTRAFEAASRAVAASAEAEAARAVAEAARAEAESTAMAKSRFLANMSHELRTPLNAIMGFSDIMRTRMFGDLPGKYGEYAQLIHESGRHLTDLINDVLDMSKIEAERYTLSREVFDAREAVNAALRLVRLQADEAGIQLRGVLPQRPLVVDADKRALKQIVLNLVSNALKFTPAGGSVTVTVQQVDDALELVVADTGVGIAKEDLERLGRPFEQAGDSESKAQGTGLGLSLVKAFARLHGGEMTIESELGEGAAVTVRLPVIEREDQPRASSAAPERSRGQGAPAPAVQASASTPPPKASRGGEVIPLNRMR